MMLSLSHHRTRPHSPTSWSFMCINLMESLLGSINNDQCDPFRCYSATVTSLQFLEEEMFWIDEFYVTTGEIEGR